MFSRVLLGFTVAAVAGCGGQKTGADGPEPDTTAADTGKTVIIEEVDRVSAGEPLKLEGATFTATKVRKIKTLDVGGATMDADRGFTFYLISLKIENTSAGELKVEERYFQVKDESEEEYPIIENAYTALNGKLTKKVQAGKSITLKLPYEVANEAEGLYLRIIFVDGTSMEGFIDL